MFKSQTFIAVALSTAAVLLPAQTSPREIKTPYYSVTLAPDGVTIESLSLDSLGHGEFRPNALLPPTTNAPGVTRPNSSQGWSFTSSTRSFQLTSVYSETAPPYAMTLSFDPEKTHTTLLAQVDQSQAALPALLHLPEYGSLRIEASSSQHVRLGYDAHRRLQKFVNITFPAASAANPRIVYTFTVGAIYPELAGIASDPRFDGFRRDYLNIFQMQAVDAVLANNSASDPCAFVLHMYSEVARHAPPLAPGLTAMDLVRLSLDRFLAGELAYGLPGYRMFEGGPAAYPMPTSDSYPSMLVAAGDYVSTTRDTTWVTRNYAGLRKWTEAMLATDTNGDGLVKYAAASGNSGSWVPRPSEAAVRPSNWWDTIGFGYEDAYSNALAYHALEEMASMATLANQPADAERYAQRAAKLRAAYLPAFLDPKTGVLAGWRSQDGKLHDYYFPWVNGAALVYGLIPPDQGNAIFDRLLTKMKEVGYTHFELGLPGNLIPVRREDYASLDRRWGARKNEDGSDGFQIYENGGATASFTFYTVVALYKLGRIDDGDRILFPILRAVKAGSFEGRGPNGRTYDWKAWDGTPHGYEGFLSDNFMVLAALMKRPAAPFPKP
jgi:hypothetical protein